MKGRASMRPRRLALIALFALALALPIGLAPAQGPYNNEREAKSRINVEDKEGIWVLDFRFKDPRLITVDIPGRGRRLVWYLWYQVINKTKEPRTFIPDFELVTLDKNTVHHDQILPKAQDAIRKLEDPTGYLEIKNSVTIASQAIPPSKPDAVPIAVTGVAMWDDVNPDASRFSIFVSGLSNGWTEVDSPQPGGKPVMRRKTLQLNFKRLGDRYYQNSQEIRFVPPEEWLYRASTLNVPSPKRAVSPAGKEGAGRTSDAAPPVVLEPLPPTKTTPPR